MIDKIKNGELTELERSIDALSSEAHFALEHIRDAQDAKRIAENSEEPQEEREVAEADYQAAIDRLEGRLEAIERIVK